MLPGFFIVKLFAGWTANNSGNRIYVTPKAAELVRRRPTSASRRHHNSFPDHHRRQQPQQQQQQEHQHQNQQQQQKQQQMINNNTQNNNNKNVNNIAAAAAAADQVQATDTRDAERTAEDKEILKRFRIVDLIGTGNYARVYRGFSQSGRELAIKSINLSKTSDNYKYKFLPRELTILKKISHPNVCKIHEIMQVSDRVYIIMQFCPRGTIADLLHKIGPFTETVARYLFAPTAEAVNYLHSIDYAHRDLKVENILLDQDYIPKLTDFSYSVQSASPADRHDRAHCHSTAHKTIRSPAAASANQHQHGKGCSPAAAAAAVQSPRAAKLNETFCGTLPYLSPEMVRQMPYDPKKTDIWSLGVCLFIMLNDKAPFLFDDIKSMVKKQLTRDYKFRAEFSGELTNLIGTMLEPDYNKRTTASEVVQHPWISSGPREKPNAQAPQNNSLI